MKRFLIWFALILVLILLCHWFARRHDASLYPPSDVIGATDSRVTDTNVQQTVCQSGYTERVRPPVRFTNHLKQEEMREYNLSGKLNDYELDHFIPLELGGCPDCRNNLWMESWSRPGAHEKDRVENYLHRQVCSGQMTLTEAQQAITHDWYQVYMVIK